MKNINRVKATLLAILMLLSMAMFAACGGNGGNTDDNGNVSYKVIVTDAVGTRYTSGMVVKFMQGGTQAGMQVVNENGEAVKELPKGDYTVELQFTDSNASYSVDTEDLTLSADKTELTVILTRGLSEKTRDLVVEGNTYEAHYVYTGCTKVNLNEDGRTYFLFAPMEAGLYEFSVAGSDSAIGYYGEPHFVQQNSALEVVDNKVKISVRDSMIGEDNSSGRFSLVIGLDPAEGETTLCIQRLGEPEWSIEDEPWVVYQPTVKLAPYTLPAGANLQKFDLTAASYNLVLNEAEGFYHLDSADGPLVLVRLGKKGDQADFVDTYETILENTGVCRYFLEGDGSLTKENFVKRENYGDCLLQYIENMDEENGVYPLTEDLKYIIQQGGIQSGWWDSHDVRYLFVDENGIAVPGINSDISWLFMCRYVA